MDEDMFFNRTNNKSKPDSRDHTESHHENKNRFSSSFRGSNANSDTHRSNNLFDIDDSVTEKKEKKVRSLDFKRIDQFRKMHELPEEETQVRQPKKRDLFAEDEANLKKKSEAQMMR